MIHPDTKLKTVNPKIGVGVFATAPIKRGTITWVTDPLDQILTFDEIARLPEVLSFDLARYTWSGGPGKLILAWDLARFINHSCEPSVLTTGYGFEIVVRNIEPGEELTNDYADLGMQQDERFGCLCGAPTCRSMIVPSDARRLRPQWSQRAADAIAAATHVRQPLASLLPDSIAAEVGLRPAPALRTRTMERKKRAG
ncbi:MAG: SET domain-containing protein-lysine N-methyltransferase [Alphaproteobacteria bacterium]|nr:SET domain-containing protein-lysine N-methyltransferase [Alphaproteobacteria bacterium]